MQVKQKERLTLIYITHLNLVGQLDYIRYIYKKTKKICNLIVAVDYKLNDDELDTLKNESFLHLVFDGKNKGKLEKILEVQHLVKTPFVKVIDHDDSIYIKGLKKFIKGIDTKVMNDMFISHTASKINSDNKYWGKKITKESLAKKVIGESYDVNWVKVPNAKAIFNTDVLGMLKELDLHSQHYFNDDFLSLSCQILKKGNLNIDERFYIQYHEFGQTSEVNEAKLNSYLNLYKNLNLVKDKYEININNVSEGYEEFSEMALRQTRQFKEKANELYEKIEGELKKLWK